MRRQRRLQRGEGRRLQGGECAAGRKGVQGGREDDVLPPLHREQGSDGHSGHVRFLLPATLLQLRSGGTESDLGSVRRVRVCVRRAFATPESPPLSTLEAPLPPHKSSRQVQPKKSDLGGVGAEETWLIMSILEIKYPINFKY